MSDKLQFVRAFGSRRVVEAGDKLKPKSTDKETENVVSINAHKGPNNFVLSPFR